MTQFKRNCPENRSNHERFIWKLGARNKDSTQCYEKTKITWVSSPETTLKTKIQLLINSKTMKPWRRGAGDGILQSPLTYLEQGESLAGEKRS